MEYLQEFEIVNHQHRRLRLKFCLLLIIATIPVIYYTNIHLQHYGYIRNPAANACPTTMHMDSPRVPCSYVSDYNWTILLAVNEGFYDFFSNWFWHYQKLGINVPMIIIAEDDVVYARLQAQFPPNCNYSVAVERSSLSSPTESLRHGTTGYKKLVSARPTHILKHLQEGIDVFYSDIDTVWLKNPFPYFNGSYDLWIEQEDGRIYCTGFMAIKSNNKTMKLMKDWKTGLEQSLQLNQPLFNKLLKASNMTFKPLNENRFPHGVSFNKFDAKHRSNVVVFHNTYVFGHDDKLKRFKKVNLWYQTM